MFVEIILLSKNSIKIKGKNASLVVDPFIKMPKTNADAVVFLENPKEEEHDPMRVEGHRVIINGPGEFEVGGIKIHGQKSEGKFVYSITLDNINIFLGKTSSLNKSHQEGRDYQMLILNVDSNLDQSLIAPFEANTIVLYGDRANEGGVKLLGKIEGEITKKFSAVREKLPTELQVVILG